MNDGSLENYEVLKLKCNKSPTLRSTMKTIDSECADSDHLPPSVDKDAIHEGVSYSYFSAIPSTIQKDTTIECVLGVDEAGRGPVLGEYSTSELRDTQRHS